MGLLWPDRTMSLMWVTALKSVRLSSYLQSPGKGWPLDVLEQDALLGFLPRCGVCLSPCGQASRGQGQGALQNAAWPMHPRGHHSAFLGGSQQWRREMHLISKSALKLPLPQSTHLSCDSRISKFLYRDSLLRFFQQKPDQLLTKQFFKKWLVFQLEEIFS